MPPDTVHTLTNAGAGQKGAASDVPNCKLIGKNGSGVARESYTLSCLLAGSAQGIDDLDQIPERIEALEKRSEQVGGGRDRSASPVPSEVQSKGSRSNSSMAPGSNVKDAELVALCKRI